MITGTRSRARRRKLLNRVLTISASIVLAAGLAMVWVRVVQTLTAPSNAPRAIGQPGALVWDGRVFETPSQLKAYLTSRGLSYARWAARHPTAFGAPAPAHRPHTTPSTRRTPTTKKTVKPSPKPKPATHHRVAAPSVTATRSKPLTSMVLTILLAVVGLLLGGSAVLPPRYAPVAVRRFYAVPDRRIAVLAAATAILLGFGVSFYLT